jgi:hypothetical protein
MTVFVQGQNMLDQTMFQDDATEVQTKASECLDGGVALHREVQRRTLARFDPRVYARAGVSDFRGYDAHLQIFISKT